MDHPWFLALVIFGLTLFGCVVGFASYEETRARRRAERDRKQNPQSSQAKVSSQAKEAPQSPLAAR